VTAGQTATFNLLLTPGPGFAGSASFAARARQRLPPARLRTRN
jgi:hypothetical protein